MPKRMILHYCSQHSRANFLSFSAAATSKCPKATIVDDKHHHILCVRSSRLVTRGSECGQYRAGNFKTTANFQQTKFKLPSSADMKQPRAIVLRQLLQGSPHPENFHFWLRDHAGQDFITKNQEFLTGVVDERGMARGDA
ncbi:hypothetical protein SELMODRAFT_417239 [Selaginella moellendorffii]|uniref:Uncharacterized protein n=1 Tax=Selaginella moellendorffii TaxID=88036 RepID=D8S2K3_SELML|nr:hypothetical protein SELMODRAFT_417239 [Selaginella moellendorffii]